jgi:hypothetical protein
MWANFEIYKKTCRKKTIAQWVVIRLNLVALMKCLRKCLTKNRKQENAETGEVRATTSTPGI